MLFLLCAVRDPLLLGAILTGSVHRGAGVLHRILSDQRGGRALPPPQDVGVEKDLCRRERKGNVMCGNVWLCVGLEGRPGGGRGVFASLQHVPTVLALGRTLK